MLPFETSFRMFIAYGPTLSPKSGLWKRWQTYDTPDSRALSHSQAATGVERV